MAAGSVVLGPIGLLGGALVGWKLSSIVAGQRNLVRARGAVVERLDEIAAELLRDVDRQVESAVESVRAAVERRRRLFAGRPLPAVRGGAADQRRPVAAGAYRRDAERFVEAFDACVARARRVVGDMELRLPELAR